MKKLTLWIVLLCLIPGLAFARGAGGFRNPQAGGGVTNITNDYTIVSGIELVSADATSADVTVTLPLAAENINTGYTIVKTDSSANIVIVDGNGTETIAAALTYRLNGQYQWIRVTSDGSNWMITSEAAGELNIKWFGAVGDGSTDDSAAIKLAIAAAGTSGARLIIPDTGSGYVFDGNNETLTVTTNVAIEGQGMPTITVSNYYRITSASSATTMTASASRGDVTITVADTSGFSIGDIVIVQSDKQASASWAFAVANDTSIVLSIPDGTTLNLTTPLNFDYDIPTDTVTVTQYNPLKFVMKNLMLILDTETYGFIFRGSHSLVLENLVCFDSDRSATASYMFGIEDSVFATGRNLSFDGLYSGVELIRCRDSSFSDIQAQFCSHAIGPNWYSTNTYISNLYGYMNQSTVSSHASFEMHINNAWVYDVNVSNLRSQGGSFRNSYFAGLSNSASFLVGHAMTADFDYITKLPDYIFENVVWERPNYTGVAGGLGAWRANRLILRGCDTYAIQGYTSFDNIIEVVIDECMFTIASFRVTNPIRISNCRVVGTGSEDALDIRNSSTRSGLYVSNTLFRNLGKVIDTDSAYTLPRNFSNCNFKTITDFMAPYGAGAGQKFKYHFSNCHFDDVAAFPAEMLNEYLVAEGCTIEGTTPSTILKNTNVATFADGDTTPSVGGGTIFKTANTATTMIATFDDGGTGQKIKLIVRDVYTLLLNNVIKLQNGISYTPSANEAIEFIYDGTNWYELPGWDRQDISSEAVPTFAGLSVDGGIVCAKSSGTEMFSTTALWNLGTNDFHVAAWIKTSDPACNFIANGTAVVNWQWNLGLVGGFLNAEVYGTPRVRVRANDVYINDGQWHHVLWIQENRSGSPVSTDNRLYVDGTEVASYFRQEAPTGDSYGFNRPVVFGGVYNLDPGYDGTYIGLIRDVRIQVGGTNVTEPQITYQAANQLDYSASSWTLDGTRDYWQFTDDRSATVIDGATNNLTLRNGTTTNYATHSRVGGDSSFAGAVILGEAVIGTPSADQARLDDSTITIDNLIVRVVGSGGAVVLDVAPAIEDGSLDGQIVIIQGTSDANTVQIADNVNCQLNGGAAVTLGKGDTIQLHWDSGDSDWYEDYRSNN